MKNYLFGTYMKINRNISRQLVWREMCRLYILLANLSLSGLNIYIYYICIHYQYLNIKLNTCNCHEMKSKWTIQINKKNLKRD